MQQPTKTSAAFLALPVLCFCLGACASSQEKDVRLAPKMSEEELRVVAESSTGTDYVDKKVVVYNSQVDEEDQVICKKEWVPGTRETEIVCRTTDQRRLDRQEVQEALRSVRRPSGCGGSAACSGGQN